MIERIKDPGDPRLADYRAVGEPELARARGLFIAEGRQVVRRLIEERRYLIQSVLVNDAALQGLHAVLRQIAERVPIYVCRAHEFVDITGYNLHRGCLALVERPQPLTPEAVLMPLTLGQNQSSTVVVLEGVTNADNVGSVFRNAAAFGAGGVLLSPTCCDPLYRKAIRTSMAATLRVPFARVAEWPKGLDQLRGFGFTRVALTPSPTATTIDDFAVDPPLRVALLVGTEGAGLTEGAESLADCRVRIPIVSEIDSVNLAVAVGIALHRLFRL